METRHGLTLPDELLGLFSEQKMKLLIIDEVHLLNEDRGAVIETIVARTLRLVSGSGRRVIEQ